MLDAKKAALPPAPLTTCYLLLATCYLLLTTHYSLLIAHYSLLTAHYSLLTTHYSLLTAHYSTNQVPLPSSPKDLARCVLLSKLPSAIQAVQAPAQKIEHRR